MPPKKSKPKPKLSERIAILERAIESYRSKHYENLELTMCRIDLCEIKSVLDSIDAERQGRTLTPEELAAIQAFKDKVLGDSGFPIQFETSFAVALIIARGWILAHFCSLEELDVFYSAALGQEEGRALSEEEAAMLASVKPRIEQFFAA
jgi:hypothetical protein